MTTRCLITGVTGFIGSKLVEQLTSGGMEVYGLQRWRHDDTEVDQCKTVYANLQDAHSVRRVVNLINPDIIYHLGAISPVSESFDRPQEYFQVNFMGTVALAEAAMKYSSNLEKFIFAGTPEEYGRQRQFPTSERVKCRPQSPYAVSKHAATTYLKYLADVEDFPSVIARHGNCYGRTRSNHFVVEAIVSQMANSSEKVRLGDPEPVRDFLYISDVISAYDALISSGDAGQIYNFGGTTCSIRELANMARDVTGFNGDITWHTRPERPGEIKRLEADDSKARNELGWGQKISLEEGLENVYDIWADE